MSDTEEIIKSMMSKNLDAARDKTRAALYTKASEYMTTKKADLATDFATTDLPDTDSEMSDGSPEMTSDVTVDATAGDAHTFVNVDSEETTEPTTETEE